MFSGGKCLKHGCDHLTQKMGIWNKTKLFSMEPIAFISKHKMVNSYSIIKWKEWHYEILKYITIIQIICTSDNFHTW